MARGGGPHLMAQITINIPDQFLGILDEVVRDAGAGTRENYIKQWLAPTLIQYEIQKEFAATTNPRMQQLLALWSLPS
jgi:metal-responsive CopG/Arc/MetJ family transcriptional regulator